MATDTTAALDQFAQMEETLTRLSKVLTTPAQIGLTPRELVWALNKTKLYRYVPVLPKEKRHPVPLLLVFALMNRPTILDLRPGHSFIEFMLNQGYDVYLVDWGSPGLEDKDLKFDDFVLDYLTRIVRKVKQVSGSEEFSMLGWCIGAILTTLYAAARPDDGLKNLILLTAPLDFSNREGITFKRWVDERYFDVEKVIAAFGNMPPEMLDYGAKALKPVDNWITNYLRMWDNVDNPQVMDAWHAMNTWVNDGVPMTAGVFRQLIVELYRKNALMNGTFKMRGEPVDLERIKANLLTVIAEADHITPPCQSGPIMDKVSSTDKELFRVKGGHIGIMAGSGASKTTWPHLNAWLGARSGREHE